MSKNPRIAILSWGSLIWDNDPFFNKWRNDWQKGGPLLPLEFSRISESREKALTLVIDQVHGQEAQTSFAVSKRDNPLDAFADLICREKTSNQNIGIINLMLDVVHCRSLEVTQRISNWAKSNGFSAVVWTDLRSNFHEKSNYKQPFTLNAARDHLKSLSQSGLVKACQYFERAPSEVDTPLLRFLNNDSWYQSLRKKHCEKDN